MGNLLQSFDKTKLDLENSGPNGIQNADTITVYSALSSGTPTSTANPGAPQNFRQVYLPTNTYINNIPIRSNLSPLNQSLDKTNLDITDPGVDGGIPYKQVKDPTVYPPTTQAKSPIRGYFATSGQGASKFDQVFTPKSTYSDFIENYR